MSVLMIIVNQSLSTYGGDEALTIYGMTFRLLSLAYLPMFGLVQGFQPVAGYNFGAKNYDRVRRALIAATGLSFAVMVVVWALFQLAPAAAMGLFTSDTGLAARAGAVLSVMALFLPLVGVQVVGATYFQAVGKAVPSMLLGLSRQFLILIPLLVLLPLIWKLSGLWWAFPLADLVATALTVAFLLVEVSHLGRRHEESLRVGAITYPSKDTV
jgi:Na+-driven multidrug efflux pump